MDAVEKDRLAARFRAALDAAQAAVPFVDGPADGPADEPDPDLFTLLGEVAGLKNEVKLESRQVKSALDEFRALFDALREAQTTAADETRRRREQERLGAEREQRDLLLELLEIRDRLEAGRGSAVEWRPRGWRARLFGGRQSRTFAASMGEGLAMNLRRLDETLARRGVRRLQALDQPFDPHRMHAAELADNPDLPRGTVVAELRPGFMLGEGLLRAAEVVVNRPNPVVAPPGSSATTPVRLATEIPETVHSTSPDSTRNDESVIDDKAPLERP
jgi:molecular chaperone GrpE